MSRLKEYERVIACRITKEEYEELKNRVEKENLTMSQKLRIIVEEYLKEKRNED